MKTQLSLFALCTTFFLLTSTTLAAGNGSNPKGKPFQALAAKIEANTVLIEANSQDILDVANALADLKLEVAKIDSDLALLSNTVADNSTEIVAAKLRLDYVEEDIGAFKSELDAIVLKHQTDVGAIDAELARIQFDLVTLASASARLSADLDAAVSALGGDLSLVQADIIALNASLTVVNSQFIALSSTQETLSDSAALLRQMITTLQTTVLDLVNRTSALEPPEVDLSISYSDDFISRVASTPDQDQKWNDFRTSLAAQSFSGVEIYNSNGGSVECNDPIAASNIAAALAAGVDTSQVCNGQRWNVGSCGAAIELNAQPFAGVCECNGYASIRPGLSPGLPSWGGIGGAFGGVGATCFGVTQTLGVIFTP